MSKQLITSDRAKVVTSQPRRPCSDCPWARTALPGWLGPLTAHEWLALAHGGGRSQCHATKGPGNRSWACAGYAIYQANVCKAPDHPLALTLPADRERVFSSPAEFAAHHGEVFDGLKMMEAGASLVARYVTEDGDD